LSGSKIKKNLNGEIEAKWKIVARELAVKTNRSHKMFINPLLPISLSLVLLVVGEVGNQHDSQ